MLTKKQKEWLTVNKSRIKLSEIVRPAKYDEFFKLIFTVYEEIFNPLIYTTRIFSTKNENDFYKSLTEIHYHYLPYPGDEPSSLKECYKIFEFKFKDKNMLGDTRYYGRPKTFYDNYVIDKTNKKLVKLSNPKLFHFFHFRKPSILKTIKSNLGNEVTNSQAYDIYEKLFHNEFIYLDENLIGKLEKNCDCEFEYSN